jgi:hypothetical protein
MSTLGSAKGEPMTPTPSQPMASVPADTHAPALNERERRLWQDHEWVLHDPGIQRTYAGSVVAVSNRTVLGTGRTHQAALASALARADCPLREQIVTVAVEGQALSGAQTPEGKERP